jgi:hypothetical protein
MESKVSIRWNFGEICLHFYRETQLADFFYEASRSSIIKGDFKEVHCNRESSAEEGKKDDNVLGSSDGTVAIIYPLKFPAPRFNTSDGQVCQKLSDEFSKMSISDDA